MINILDHNTAYVLQTDKIQGKWWLELVERKTGLTQIMICDTKKHALAAFKGMTLEQCAAWLDRAKFEKKKVYKAGYTPESIKEVQP